MTALAARLDEARRHPRHLLLAGLVAGLALGGVVHGVWPVAAAAAAAAGASPWLAAWVRGAPASAAVLGAGVLLALAAGAALAHARIGALDATRLTPLIGREVHVTAVLLEPPRTKAWGAVVAPARLAMGERVLLRLASHGGVRARWPRSPTGAEVSVRGRLRALGAADDYERRRGAHAQISVDELAPTGRRRGGPAGALDGVRRRAEAALASALPAKEAALGRGMVLGQDDALADDVREDFRASGLSHLLAASGTNVALLAALVLGVATAAGLGLTGRLVLALVAIAAYVPLAGGGPSIQRAGVMGAAALLAMLAGRPASRWYALLLAAAVTLGLNPYAIGDIGWQLSFAAVVALLAIGPSLAQSLRRVLPGVVAEALALTVAATLGTAPLVALHFGRLSVVSVVANLLAAPVVAPVMWLGAIAAVLGQVTPAVASVPAALAGPPLGYLGWLARTAARMPGADASFAVTPLGAAVLYAGLAAIVAAARRPWVSRLRRTSGRTRVAAAAALVLALVVGAARARGPGPPDGLVVSFLDVGQGDATLIQHGEHAVLVDTGRPGGPIVRRLREAGARRLDALVITHASADHDGGAAAVLQAVPVGEVLDGGEVTQRTAGLRAAAAEARSRRVARVASDVGQVLRAGPIVARVLWPPRSRTAAHDADPNLRATVLHVSDGAFDLLLSADAESEVLRRITLPAVEAMKVPHHGSSDPGLPEVLERLRPRVAVIPVGRNTYGHPAPSTLAALRAAVPVVRRTDTDGTVRLRVARDGMRVDTAR